MAGRIGFKVATTSVGTAAVVTANFAPVPYLAPAVGVVIGIIQLCQNVGTNKRAIIDLGSRCESLLYALKDSSNQFTPERMQIVVNSSAELLENIKQRMIGWIESSKLKQFFLQDDISEDVKRCHQAIDSFLTNFQITSHMEIHNWMATFEENRKQDHAEAIQYLSDIRNEQHIMHGVIVAQQIENAKLMAVMQNFMGMFPMGDYRHSGLSSNLYRVQKTSGQLLPEIELKHGEVRRLHDHPVGGSPAFDIWLGEYLGKEKCAIKVIRGVEVSAKIRDRFLREVMIWRKMWDTDKGEYILPFWGACLDDGPYPYMVSPWMEFGDALSYIKKYPTVNRKRIIRRIAGGLRLLHTQDPPIAHGDIKAANILINDHGNPLLADFGLSKIMEDMTGVPFTQSRGVSDSYRWFAPELCSAPGILSPASDVFAFAMTVLELMTDMHPFAHIKRTPEVLIKMQIGERPHRPEGSMFVERGLDDKLWDLLTRCWVTEPEKRPTIQQVLEELPVD